MTRAYMASAEAWNHPIAARKTAAEFEGGKWAGNSVFATKRDAVRDKPGTPPRLPARE
jgi:hypothetical protein